MSIETYYDDDVLSITIEGPIDGAGYYTVRCRVGTELTHKTVCEDYDAALTMAEEIFSEQGDTALFNMV